MPSGQVERGIEKRTGRIKITPRLGKKVDAFHTDWRAFFKQCTLDLDGKEVERQIQALNQAHGVQPTSNWGIHSRTDRDLCSH